MVIIRIQIWSNGPDLDPNSLTLIRTNGPDLGPNSLSLIQTNGPGLDPNTDTDINERS